jgi:hypothetical protein
VVPFALSLFDRAAAGERVTNRFRATMSVQGAAQPGDQLRDDGDCHKVCVRQERMEPHAFNTTEEVPIPASLV